jgi:hypothetical protein
MDSDRKKKKRLVFGGSRLYVFPLCNLFNWVIGLGCSGAGGIFFSLFFWRTMGACIVSVGLFFCGRWKK